jgi:hypothetical protein
MQWTHPSTNAYTHPLCLVFLSSVLSLFSLSGYEPALASSYQGPALHVKLRLTKWNTFVTNSKDHLQLWLSGFYFWQQQESQTKRSDHLLDHQSWVQHHVHLHPKGLQRSSSSAKTTWPQLKLPRLEDCCRCIIQGCQGPVCPPRNGGQTTTTHLGRWQQLRGLSYPTCCWLRQPLLHPWVQRRCLGNVGSLI